MDKIVNSHSLQRSQIKGTPLHQGQLLYNSLLAKRLTDALLLNPNLRMPDKARGHIYPLLFLLAMNIDFLLFLLVLTERD